MYWENSALAEAGGSIHSPQAPGQPPSNPPPNPPPRWSSLEGHAGSRTPAPVRRRASNITAWGGEFGEEGEGRGEQVAISLAPSGGCSARLQRRSTASWC